MRCSVFAGTATFEAIPLPTKRRSSAFRCLEVVVAIAFLVGAGMPASGTALAMNGGMPALPDRTAGQAPRTIRHIELALDYVQYCSFKYANQGMNDPGLLWPLLPFAEIVAAHLLFNAAPIAPSPA